MNKNASLLIGLASALLAVGCGHDEHDHAHENEVFTTVTLTFTPSAGGTPVVAKVDDPDGDGGNPPTVEPITLAAGMYDMTVKLENRLENPPEDLTKEVRDEGDEHQLFFFGNAVSGPASNQAGAALVHSYADMDAKGLPIGLANKVTASAGTGMLTVVLRHMPPLNGAAVKTATSAETVRTSGLSALGGSTDVSVTFPVTVQ